MTFEIAATVSGPHARARIVTAGRPLAEAGSALVFLHGRGASAEDILALARELDAPESALVAPQAQHETWYPYSFLAPLERNEPHLSSALMLVGAIVGMLEESGIPPARQLLLGFSQGGCLALEFVGRNARRYGGVAGLSAGLIGPPGRQWDFGGSLEGTPVFIGCSDSDPHIPRERVEESGRELARIGGAADVRIYPGLGHTVNRDELDHLQEMVEALRRK